MYAPHSEPPEPLPLPPKPADPRPGVVSDAVPRSTRRSGIGLCLSGGGLRASLFHLGALRYLHEQGVTPRLRTISSVSGGSIFSGHLAERMLTLQVKGGVRFGDWEQDVAESFREAARRDYRTLPVLLSLPWNWLWPGPRIRSVIHRYRRFITSHQLSELPSQPNFAFCASDVVFGVNWVFSKTKAGDYQAGTARQVNWSIAEAIGASACFPPVFGPMPLHLMPQEMIPGHYRGDDREALVARLALSDGGVYDNLALEPVWKDHQYVLVSDCGAPFRFKYSGGYFGRTMRCAGVCMNQAAAMRKRAFFSDIAENDPQRPARFHGAYWGIAGAVDQYKDPQDQITGYSEDLVSTVIEKIRTDLGRFTDAEMRVLENHGYLLAAAVMRRRRADLLGPGTVDWKNPPEPPHADWMDEARVRQALRDSHKRFSLKRLFGAE